LKIATRLVFGDLVNRGAGLKTATFRLGYRTIKAAGDDALALAGAADGEERTGHR